MYVEPTDALRFARTIAEFAGNPELLDETSQRGVMHATRHTWTSSCDQLKDALA